MKASEMTNKMLADECESVADYMEKYGGKGCGMKLREASARLRKRIEFTPEMATEMCRRESDLRRRLKVAEDALEYAKGSITRDCTNDCDHLQECGDFKVCLCEQRINNALAAIREEGGGKPIRNCDRFETAEDAYNACPQFFDIDVKTMTDRELKIVEATLKGLEWLFAPTEQGSAS